jgi:hypothetical protein
MKTRKIGGRCCQYEKADSAFCRAPHNTVTSNAVLSANDLANRSEMNGVVAGVQDVPLLEHIGDIKQANQNSVRVVLAIHLYKHIDEININCKDRTRLKALIIDNINKAIFFSIDPTPAKWPEAVLIHNPNNFNLFSSVTFANGDYGIALNVTRIRLVNPENQSKWVIFRGKLEDQHKVGKVLTISALISSNSDLVDVVAGVVRQLHTGYTNNISKFKPDDVAANGLYEIDTKYPYNKNEHNLNNCLKEYILRLQLIQALPIFFTDYMHYTFLKKPVQEKCEALRKLIATVFADNNPQIQRGIKPVEFVTSFGNAEERLDTIYDDIRNLCRHPHTGACKIPTLEEISRAGESLLAPLLYNGGREALLHDIVLFQGDLCRVTLLENDTLHIDSDPANIFPLAPKTDTDEPYNRVTLFNDFKTGDTIDHNGNVVITSVEDPEIIIPAPALPGGAGGVGQVRVNKNTCRALKTINTFYIYKYRQFISRFRTDANKSIEELTQLQASAVDYIDYINKNRPDFDEEIFQINQLPGSDPETTRRKGLTVPANNQVTTSHAAADASAATVTANVDAAVAAAVVPAPAPAAAAAVPVAPDAAALDANTHSIIGIINGYVTNLETQIATIPFDGAFIPAYGVTLNNITTNIQAYTANITEFIRVFTENNTSLENYQDTLREQLSIIKKKVEGLNEKIFKELTTIIEGISAKKFKGTLKLKIDDLNTTLTDADLRLLKSAYTKYNNSSRSPDALNDLIVVLNPFLHTKKIQKKGGTRRRNKRTRRRRTLKFR